MLGRFRRSRERRASGSLILLPPAKGSAPGGDGVLIIAAALRRPAFPLRISPARKRCLRDTGVPRVDRGRPAWRNCGFLMIVPALRQPVESSNLGIVAVGIG